MIFIIVITSLLLVFNITILQVLDKYKDNYYLFSRIIVVVLINILLSFIGVVLSIYYLSLI